MPRTQRLVMANKEFVSLGVGVLRGFVRLIPNYAEGDKSRTSNYPRARDDIESKTRNFRT